MNNLEVYNDTFKEAFGLEEDQLLDLEYQSISDWDSVGHMELIAALEDAFDIMMETDDIIEFSSYAKGKELLGKYGVVLNGGRNE